MSIIDTIRQAVGPRETRAAEASSTLEFPSSWLLDVFGARPVKSGSTVTEQTAIENTAVLRAVTLISSQIATVPLNVYKRIERGKEEASDHPLHYLLKYQPNPEMTAFHLKEAAQAHLLLWGNAYAEIEFDQRGEIVALWPLTPWRVTPKRTRPTPEHPRGFAYYEIALPDGRRQNLASWQIFHIPGFGFDGRVGKSPIRIAREAVGLALATEEFGARFFGDGTHIASVLETDKQLSPEAYERLKKDMSGGYKGLTNSHRLKILEEGLKYKQLGVPPEDAQFLETRKFQVSEIARIFGVPAHLLGDLEKATFSNIEHQGIEFVKYCLASWAKRWEQVIQMKLILANKDRYFAEFKLDALERGDIKTRYEAYATARQNGWLSANDIRQLENLNPIPGGDEYLVQVNMTPADKLTDATDAKIQALKSKMAQPATRSADPAPRLPQGEGMLLLEERIRELRAKSSAAERSKLTAEHRAVFAQALAPIIEAEVEAIRAAAKEKLSTRSTGSFREWLEAYYSAALADEIKELLLPTFRAFAELIHQTAAEEIEIEAAFDADMQRSLEEYVDSYVTRHTLGSINQIDQLARDALTDGDAAETIEERLDGWRDTRADKEADNETVKLSGFITKATYVVGGIESIRWVNTGSKSCPLCESLDGKIVGIREAFLAQGDTLDPGGVDPLTTRGKITHPPLHRGCRCQIVAER